MPTVYVRKDLHDNIISLGENPTDFVNKMLDKVFVKTVEYIDLEKQIETVAKKQNETVVKKKVKKDV